jgi:hypothetical protein
MSNSISTLLLRNLSDVFGENDPVRRRAAIDEIFQEDAVFYDKRLTKRFFEGEPRKGKSENRRVFTG